METQPHPIIVPGVAAVEPTETAGGCAQMGARTLRMSGRLPMATGRPWVDDFS